MGWIRQRGREDGGLQVQGERTCGRGSSEEVVSEEVKRPRGQSTVTGDQLTWKIGVIAAHLQPTSGLLVDRRYAQCPWLEAHFTIVSLRF